MTEIPGVQPRSTSDDRITALTQPVGPRFQSPFTEPPSIGGEFIQGVQAGGRNLGAAFTAAGGVLASLFGADTTAESLLRLARETDEQTAIAFPRTVRFIEDVDSVEDFARWMARALGEQVTTIASILIGGGVGTVAGRAVGAGAASIPAITGAVARLPQLTAKIGGATGSLGVASTIETGATGLELFEATGEIHPEVALLAGLAKGSLEAIVPSAVGRTLGISSNLGKQLTERIAAQFNRIVPQRIAAASGAATVETITESLQESIDIAARAFVDDNFAILTPENASRILNAAATGALVGGVLGGAFSRRRVRVTEQTDKPLQLPAPPTQAALPPPENTRLITLTPPEVNYLRPFFDNPADQRDFQENIPNAAGIRLEGNQLTIPENSILPFLDFVEESTSLDDKPGQTPVRFRAGTRANGRFLQVAFQSPQGPTFQLNPSAGGAGVPINVTDEFVTFPLEETQRAILEDSGILAETGAIITDEGQLRVPTSTFENFTFAVSTSVDPTTREADILSPQFLQAINQQVKAILDTTSVADLEPLTANATPNTVNLPVALSSTDFNATFQVTTSPEFNPEGEILNIDEANQAVVRLQSRGHSLRDINIFRTTPNGQAEIVSLQDINVVPARLRAEGGLPFDETLGEGVQFPLELSAFVPGERVASDVPYLHTIRENADVVVDLAGRKYDVDSHRPGTAKVVMHRDHRISNRRVARRVESFYNLMMQEFGLKTDKLLVYFDTLFPAGTRNVFDPLIWRVGDIEGGVHQPTTGDLQIIGLTPTRTIGQQKVDIDPASFFQQAVHEFGHYVMFEAMASADTGMLYKILAAYNRALIKANMGLTEDFQQAFLSGLRQQERMFDVDQLQQPLEQTLSEIEPAFDIMNELLQIDPTNPGPRDVYYSKVLEAAEDVRQEVGTPEQFVGQIRKKLGLQKVKPGQGKPRLLRGTEEELDYLGIEAAFSGRTRITKTELIDYIRHSRVTLEEVVLTGAGVQEQFDDWVLPGQRSNYREFLIKLPFRPPGEGNFTGKHFIDHANVIAWIRLTDRQTPDGRRVLFIEEIQSDWHQLGRKKGYLPRNVKQLVKLRKLREEERQAREKLWLRRAQESEVTEGLDVKRIEELEELRADLVEKREAVEQFLREHEDLKDLLLSSVPPLSSNSLPPDAPFKKTWHELAFRRMARLAAEEGYDEIGWTTGQQQVDRYDELFADSLSRIEWELTEDGAFHLVGYIPSILGRIVPSVTGDPLEMHNMVVPKNKLRLALPVPSTRDAILRAVEAGETKGSIGFENEDGRLQEVGMFGFYDERVTNYAKKFGKQLNAEYRQDEIVDFSGQIDAESDTNNVIPEIVDDRHTIHMLSVSPELMISMLDRGVSLFQVNEAAANYLLSADEFFAEQFAKYIEGNVARGWGAEAGFVEAFFHEIAQRIKRMFKMAREFFGLDAEPEMREFFDALRKRKETVKEGRRPLFQVALEKSENRSSAENRAALGDDVNVDSFVPANQGESLPMFNFLRNMGVPPQRAKQLRAHADRFGFFSRLLMNIKQVSLQNPHIESLRNYVELNDLWHNFEIKWMSRANDTVTLWGRLNRKEQDRLAAFMDDLDQLRFLPPDAPPRQPNAAELKALAQKHNLSDAAKDLYENVIKEDLRAVLDQIETTLVNDINNLFPDVNGKPTPSKAARIREITQTFDALRARPYFPHMRFGDWSVTVRTEGEPLEHMHFMTKREALNAEVKIRQQTPDAVIKVRQVPEEMNAYRMLPPQLLQKLLTLPEMTATQKDWIELFVAESLPGRSFARRLQRRRNIPGYSLNARQAYARYMQQAARYMARIDFKPQMQFEIDRIDKEINELAEQGLPTVRRSEIQNMLRTHLEHVTNPKPDWAAWRVAAFFYYLGFNVSSAVLNFTQIPMVAYPFLAARFGDAAAVKALGGGMKGLQQFYRELDTQLDPSRQRIISKLVEVGAVDESMSAELSAVSNPYADKLGAGTGNLIQRSVMHISHWGSFMFQQSERINRRVVARAAIELAHSNPDNTFLSEVVEQHPRLRADLEQEGWTDVEIKAFLAALESVRQTQFSYWSGARPEFMRGRKGTILTFFMFTQNMLYFMRHDPGRGRALLMMLMAAGPMGLPFAKDLSAVVRVIARQLFGEDWDPEKEMRKVFMGIVDDPRIADVMLMGLGREGFGIPMIMEAVGIPAPYFDFSRRIGLGQVIPGVAELGRPGLDADSLFSNVGTQVAGASFGMGINMIRFLLDSTPLSDPKRWERAMPLAMKNISRAFRFYREERERTSTGATLLNFDFERPEHFGELALTAMGFQPTRLTREWDAVIARKEIEQYWLLRRRHLLKEYDHTYIVNDPEGRRTVMRWIKEFNKEAPSPRLRLTARQLARSRRARIKARRRFERGQTRTNIARDIGREVDQLFPTERSRRQEESREDFTRPR